MRSVRRTVQSHPDRIAIVGHSAGGWTALALPETDTRIQAVVALAHLNAALSRRTAP
jgi:dipeptidyl aminopeptidase/acylaminoacyl peptidase